LLVRFPADRTEAFAVSDAVNSVKNNVAACIEPIQT